MGWRDRVGPEGSSKFHPMGGSRAGGPRPGYAPSWHTPSWHTPWRRLLLAALFLLALSYLLASPSLRDLRWRRPREGGPTEKGPGALLEKRHPHSQPVHQWKTQGWPHWDMGRGSGGGGWGRWGEGWVHGLRGRSWGVQGQCWDSEGGGSALRRTTGPGCSTPRPGGFLSNYSLPSRPSLKTRRSAH